MSPKQFEALAQLLRLRAGPARSAAYLVLVEGKAVSLAAATVELDYRSAHKAVQRCRKGLALARQIVGK